MSYQAAVGYLYGLQKFGMKFGLDNMRRLMELFGDPHTSFRSIHVAGTNGKGSTSAMIESILRTGGLRTGLFTSPHLVSFTERIRVNSEEISVEEVVSLVEEVRAAVSGLEDFSPTFFEVVTTMAFLYFRRMKVQWAVIETGLGGRLDATNVISPEASVITMIDYDHREFLGDTLAVIAGEKSGIIKENCPVISALQAPEAAAVLKARAEKLNAPLFRYGEEFSPLITDINPEAPVFIYNGSASLPGIRLPLAGLHQVLNASLAAKAAEVIMEKIQPVKLDIKKGIEAVRWPGRLELVSEDPPIMLDGAHNPHAAAALAEHLKLLLKRNYDRIILVLGIMADKDIQGIIAPLVPLAKEVIVAAAAYGRAATSDVLSKQIASLGYKARCSSSVQSAISEAKEICRPGDLIVITGSFYTIGEAREILLQPGVLSRLRE